MNEEINTDREYPDYEAGEKRLTEKSVLMVIIVGLLLSLLYWRLIPHIHNYPHAGKEFYIGAKLLVEGKNPYSSPQLEAASRQYAPEGMVAGFERQPQIHLPATLAVLAPFSQLPWPLFCFLQVVVNAFCIPGIVYLCLCYLTSRPSLWSLTLLSLFVAFLAPTWQNVVIGQIALPLVLCFLLLARSFARHQVRRLAVLTFFALLKFTFALPLIAYVFWKGSRAQRLGMAAAAAVFVLLNTVAVLRIGPQAFLSGYKTQVGRSFGPGGLNDVRTADGQSMRLDIASFRATFPATAEDGFLKAATFALLVGAFLYKAKEQPGFSLWHVSALSLLTLLLFYHRTYDAVLLLPCLFFGFRAWREQRGTQDWRVSHAWKSRPFRALPLVLMGLILLTFGSIGNGSHSVVDVVLRHLRTSPPLYLHSLLALSIYLVLIFISEKMVVSATEPKAFEEVWNVEAPDRIMVP